MNPKETVSTLMGAVQSGDTKKAKSLLTDDFQFSGPIPEPVNGSRWMEVTASLRTGFPDLDYHFNIEGVDDNVVHLSAQLTGTHTGNLDLKAVGINAIPATGKPFSMARELADVTVRNDKVVSWAGQATEGAGLVALLTQLGIEVPTT